MRRLRTREPRDGCRRCRRRRCERGFWQPGRRPATTTRDEGQGLLPSWQPGFRRPSAQGKNLRGERVVAAELELRTVIEGKGETLVDGTRVEKMCLAFPGPHLCRGIAHRERRLEFYVQEGNIGGQERDQAFRL
jgi:hypothetical protein